MPGKPICYQIRHTIRRPVAEVYDFIVVHQAQNHPKWEHEVLELRLPEPPVTGSRGVMVRKDFGRVTEMAIDVLEVVEGRRVRQCSDAGGVRFEITTEMAPIGGDTELTFTIEVTLSGPIRLMRPLMARMFRRNSERILGTLVGLLEPQAAAPPAASAVRAAS